MLWLGSAGAKTMAVITGTADIYVHDGGMYQWDSAAPAAVAQAAGLRQQNRWLTNHLQRPRCVASRPHRVPTRTLIRFCEPCGDERNRIPASDDLRAIRYRFDGPVAIVELHRPHRASAWNGTMHGVLGRDAPHRDAR